MAIYRISQHGKDDILIRARTVVVEHGGLLGSPSLRFEGDDGEAAVFTVHHSFSVAPEHMLFTTFTGDMLQATKRESNDGSSFLEDALLSEADKKPFTPNEQRVIAALIEQAKESIQNEFDPSDDQQQEIAAKLDYLSRKVGVLNKFDWKRLFIASLVGISVDLCFGTSVPVALIALFRQVLVTLAERSPAKQLST
jgi:hypothetical protein